MSYQPVLDIFESIYESDQSDYVPLTDLERETLKSYGLIPVGSYNFEVQYFGYVLEYLKNKKRLNQNVPLILSKLGVLNLFVHEAENDVVMRCYTNDIIGNQTGGLIYFDLDSLIQLLNTNTS